MGCHGFIEESVAAQSGIIDLLIGPEEAINQSI